MFLLITDLLLIITIIMCNYFVYAFCHYIFITYLVLFMDSWFLDRTFSIEQL